MKKLTLVVGLALVLACALGIYAQSPPRVFMLVTARVEPGHMAEYRSIVENEVLPIFAKHDVAVIGAFNSQLGASSNEMLLLVGYRDLAHIQATNSDPALVKLQAEKFEAMRVLETRVLIPTSFSPLK